MAEHGGRGARRRAARPEPRALPPRARPRRGLRHHPRRHQVRVRAAATGAWSGSTRRSPRTRRASGRATRYEPGRAQPSFDKQYVRDYLETLDWDKRPPGPPLPDDVVTRTREKYLEAHARLTGTSARARAARRAAAAETRGERNHRRASAPWRRLAGLQEQRPAAPCGRGRRLRERHSVKQQLDTLVSEMIDRGILFTDARREFEKRFIAARAAAPPGQPLAGGQGPEDPPQHARQEDRGVQDLRASLPSGGTHA